MINMIRRLYLNGGEENVLIRDTLEKIGLYVTNTGNIVTDVSKYILHQGLYFHENEISKCECCGKIEVGVSSRYSGVQNGTRVHFCSELCAQNFGMRKDRWGELIYNPSVGQVGKGEYTSSTKTSETSEEHPFLIGLEIEKEDPKLYKKLCDHSEGLQIPKDWLIVHDGSLSDDCGFEAVSHGYNITGERERLDRDLDSITELLNGRTTVKCGGHITVSEKGLSGLELAKELKPLAVLLLTLFPTRMKNNKINMLTFNSCANPMDKYTPLRILDDRVEFRMISAVKSKNSLKRRIDLFEWFLKNKPSFRQVKKEMEKDGLIQQLFSKVYGEESWEEKQDSFNDMSFWFCWNQRVDEVRTLVHEF